MRRWKIALGQIPVAMGDKEANVASILEAVRAAARRRCDVLVLPECSLAGWLSPAGRRAAEPIRGPVVERLSEEARRRRLAIVVGIEEREEGRLYNAAVLIDREGRLVAHHRKINELPVGSRLYGRGRTLQVAELEGRPVALSICADSWLPDLTDALYAMGARLIFSPCAWAVDPGGEACNIAWIRETYGARTRGRDLVVVSSNGVGRVTQGPWKGKVLHGQSLVSGPDGGHLLQGPRGRPALLTVEA